MKVTQLKDILGSVTSEVLGKEDVLAEDLSNLVDVGNEIVVRIYSFIKRFLGLVTY